MEASDDEKSEDESDTSGDDEDSSVEDVELSHMLDVIPEEGQEKEGEGHKLDEAKPSEFVRSETVIKEQEESQDNEIHNRHSWS